MDHMKRVFAIGFHLLQKGKIARFIGLYRNARGFVAGNQLVVFVENL